MTLRVTPWGKDDFKATSEEAESKDWAYWQNRLNRASLVMLAEEGIIDKNIVPRIAAAQKHAEDLQNLPGAPRLTDIMPLEKMLIESCGEEATLIHTGRSRQDMFTTLNEARLRLAVLDFYEALNKLRTRLLSIARENIETYIPAYTNGVQAMPITLAFYLWGFLESFQRDSDRIIESYKRINQSALGVAVLACSSWPLNRERLAELLGFEKPITNGLDAAQISLFDIPLEAASNTANVAIRIGTLVQDLAQQYSQTRPWLLLDSGAAYGSSAMPQKRNPGILNKTRGTASDVVGAMQTSFLRAHNLQLGMYDNKESVLEDCSGVFVKGVEMLELMEQAFSLLKVNPARSLEELNSDWTTTMALAEALQRQFEIPFRIGHTFASQIVTYARARDLHPDNFPFEAAKEIFGNVTEQLEDKRLPFELTQEEFRTVLSPEHAVQSDVGTGSPAPANVRRGLDEIAIRLEEDEQRLRAWRNALANSDKALDEAFEKLLNNKSQEKKL